MKSQRIVSTVRLLALPLLLTLCLSMAQGQERSGADASAKQAGASKAKKRAKPRGRLPAYFSRVVTAVQREKIYTVQAKYREQIEKLKSQLRSLEMERDKEVHDVLSDEQKEKVAEFQSEAKKRREARSKSRSNPRQADSGSNKR